MANTSIEAILFTVELTHTVTDDQGVSNNPTELVQVFCQTAERSIEIAKERYTDAVIKSIRNSGDQVLLVDQDLIS